jgi:hypothetical protein
MAFNNDILYILCISTTNSNNMSHLLSYLRTGTYFYTETFLSKEVHQTYACLEQHISEHIHIL